MSDRPRIPLAPPITITSRSEYAVQMMLPVGTGWDWVDVHVTDDGAAAIDMADQIVLARQPGDTVSLTRVVRRDYAIQTHIIQQERRIGT